MRKLIPILLIAGCGSGAFARGAEEYERGNKAYRLGDYEGAVPHYSFVVLHREELHEAHLRLALCHEKLGQIPEGVRVLSRFLRAVNPRNETGWRILARLEASRNYHDEAIAAYRRLLKLEPADADKIRAEVERLEGDREKK